MYLQNDSVNGPTDKGQTERKKKKERKKEL